VAKTIQLKPEEAHARAYADRLILEQITELQAVVKLSEIAERLTSRGIGLAAIRALLASNPDKFAYSERRWVPASRLEGAGRPVAEIARLIVDRFGGPVPVGVLTREIAQVRGPKGPVTEEALRRIASSASSLFLTARDEVALSSWAFIARDETEERAYALNGVSRADVESVAAKLAGIDWFAAGASSEALRKAAPVSLKVLGAVAWRSLNSQDPRAQLFYDWRALAGRWLAEPDYVFAADGSLHLAADARKWITAAVRLAEKIAPSVEIEDAAPIEVKASDVDRMVRRILEGPETVTAAQLLEVFYEITPSVKTYPDDLAIVTGALTADPRVWWVGGDRFRAPGSCPEFIHEVPDVFQFFTTDMRDEEGELVDVELTDEGLSSTLRKLLNHPLATDVLDEEPTPQPKQMAEQLRLVLKALHRELGTFPMCQFPAGWLPEAPNIQELIFVDPEARELQVWANLEARLLFNLIDWFLDQPIESGAVFSLTRTSKPNVYEFAWLEQPDPVVYITSQRMEELRDLQARSGELATLQVLQEVMSHWPKGADFLTILWEVNVVRRVPRRLIASLLSSYLCFYQRSGSPVWHYDAKKVEHGIDKTKRKFVRK
jgi:hypothetical protein